MKDYKRTKTMLSAPAIGREKEAGKILKELKKILKNTINNIKMPFIERKSI